MTIEEAKQYLQTRTEVLQEQAKQLDERYSTSALFQQ
jgi:hypothetical protein